MRHPAYPEYKESGVQWLGQVPGHWEVKRLKYSATINDEALPETTDPDFEFSYIDIGSVNPVEGITNMETITFENAPSRARRKVVPGDTIVSTVRTYLRAIAPIPETSETLIASTGFAVIRPRKLSAGFLAYALRESSFVESVVARSTGVSYPAVNASEIGDIEIPLPAGDEQTAIAHFLDRETTRIDTLVAKKRRLIALLKEKRTALISRTVTRGLPADVAREFGLKPHTRFKDSGIEWLGQVPEGWEVHPIKRIVSIPITDGPHETPEILDDGIPFVSAEAINNGRINFDRIRGYISEEDHIRYSKKYKPEYGDIYIVKSGATTGRIAMVETDEGFNIWSPLAAIRCKSSIADRIYVYFYLQSMEFQKAVELHWSFGTQQNIGMRVIQNLSVPIGETKEQTAIATYLYRETAKIDKLVEKVGAAIARLQEYRTALITAAVTGKIDVREVVA